MSRFSQHQRRWWQSWRWCYGVWRRVLLLLAVFAAAQAAPGVSAGAGADTPRARATVATADPQVIFAQAQAWPAHGAPFPDAVLRQAVETALRPEAPEDQVTAAITAFDLYQDRPWVPQVLQPFVVYHATHIVLNADVFARIHCGWTKRAVAMAAPQAPGLVLSVLKILSPIDPVWAKQLATTVAATTPALVWSHVDALIAVDAQWAESLLRDAAKVTPYHALYMVRSYITAPWGAQFFADLVLQEPRWVVNVVTSGAEQYDAVRQALDAAAHPAVQALAQLAQSDYSRDTKERMAVFAEELAAHTLSLEEAAHLSSDALTYFRTLVALRLRDAAGEHHAIESTLAEEASTLASAINSLLEQPAAIRFHAVESLAAHEIYLVLTYGEAEMFTSSYRGVFDRLLARMRQEGLTGDQLLADVHHLHFRVFIKAAAVFNRLTMFLATIPSPVARWALLTRCMSDLERTTDMTVQAVTAAEIVSAPLDRDSLRLMRDTLRSEYRRVEMEHSQHGRIIYGLLIAALTQRYAAELADPALIAIAASYLPALPDLTGIPMDALFPNGVSIHRYFFYHDEDGEQSFASFMAHYRHDPAWHIEDHGSFVHLRSQGPGRQIEIYANTFTDDDQGSNDIEEVFRARKVSPTVIVHRGHSIYVNRTLEQLPATAALVYLGNCGGHTLLETVLRQAPQAHVITTKGIGTITINDPLLKAFNTSLLRGTDLTWQRFWRHLEARLGRNPRFMDYVPPDKNASVVFLRAYHRLTAETQPAVARVP